jgi:hypothetical protein
LRHRTFGVQKKSGFVPFVAKRKLCALCALCGAKKVRSLRCKKSALSAVQKMPGFVPFVPFVAKRIAVGQKKALCFRFFPAQHAAQLRRDALCSVLSVLCSLFL